MATFEYHAIQTSDRSRTKGIINANNEREARELLRDQDLIVSKMKKVATQATSKGGGRDGGNIIQQLMSQMFGVSTKEKITFTRNIGMMIRAGIPLTEALMYFENFVKNAKFKSVISQIRSDIMTGMAFSAALARHKDLFDDVYINVTKAGETSGELDQTMSRLTDLMVKADKMKMKIIAAMIYPALVLVIVGIVLIIMFVLVIPTFVDIYKQMGVSLPLITQIMFEISKFMRGQWYIAFPLLGTLIFLFIKYVKSPSGKVVIDKILIKLPVVKDLIIYTQNSQFISTFYVSFGAGIPITEALYLSTQTVTHSQIRESFNDVNTKIQSGQRLATSLAATGNVPEIVLLMISSGEESGDLDKMLQRCFEYLEEEINHKVEILMAMMEPIMLLFIGVVVGFVALSIYLPLFSVYEFL